MPYGESIAPVKSLRAFSVKPNLVRSSVRLPWSRIRITIFSPKSVGSVETRNSTVFVFIRILIRPSCGIRRSDISRSLIILSRDVTAALSLFGKGGISINVPSTLNRTLTCFSKGSMWMSDVPRLTASTRSELTSRTRGASSAL